MVPRRILGILMLVTPFILLPFNMPLVLTLFYAPVLAVSACLLIYKGHARKLSIPLLVWHRSTPCSPSFHAAMLLHFPLRVVVSGIYPRVGLGQCIVRFDGLLRGSLSRHSWSFLCREEDLMRIRFFQCEWVCRLSASEERLKGRYQVLFSSFNTPRNYNIHLGLIAFGVIETVEAGGNYGSTKSFGKIEFVS
ncbi:hypothetical protein KEJ17_05790 [Candidatus Bathyarchaeota archaeon]|nr:hypothetical protein [Candidatus Bathyarchaeota archaeon]